MRIFSLVGLLITILIIGWLAATSLRSTTGGPAVSPVVTPAVGGAQVTTGPIERAQELASADKERQQRIEDLAKELE